MKARDAFGHVRLHWALCVVAVIGAVLIFTNLGSDYLWADEGDTAVLASNIVKFGLPRAWDGRTFMDSDFGARENNQLVMVSSPWVQYYVAAGSFLLFGENTFAVRLPFALAAWITILLAYHIVWRTTASRSAAFCAAALLVSSVQFLLYSRQSRYYALSMLFSCWLLWIFCQMKSLRMSALFGIVSILLFHIHPLGLVLVGILALLTLLYPPLASRRRWFWPVLPAIIAFTVPWFGFARAGYTENSAPVRSVGDFVARFGQHLIECASVTPLIGVVVLTIFLAARRGFAHGSFEPRERDFLFVILATVVGYTLAMAASQRTAAMWVTGLRYTSALIPLIAMAAGCLIVKVSRQRILVWVALLLVFVFTNFAQITPWLFWADKNPNPEGKIVAAHVPNGTIDCFFPTGELLFVRDLWRSNVGTVGQCSQFLRENAQPNDLIITNYESEPLYFHTRLPQAMKIMRQDVIYDIARRRNLPDYVFGVDHARWVVWRFNWDDYLGIPWSEVESHLLAEGGRIKDAAEIKETSWENRENIHFHRFSGDEYLFPQDTNRLAAHIFQIDWPVE